MTNGCFGSPVTRRILIVGDLSLSRGLMRMVLSRLDYLVTCVASGEEAMQALRAGRFAVLMVALQLSDMPGVALVRRLRQARDAPRLPALLMFGSAWDQAEAERDCHAAGAAVLLPKPIAIGRLVATVHALSGRSEPDDGGTALLPLDPARLMELTEGDEQLERELTALYLSSAAIYVDELSLALEEGRDWSGTALALKGASAGIGATGLAELAERARQAPPSSRALGDILAGLDALRAFVDAGPSARALPMLATV
jgi:CheY-like chemotaxis protein